MGRFFAGHVLRHCLPWRSGPRAHLGGDGRLQSVAVLLAPGLRRRVEASARSGFFCGRRVPQPQEFPGSWGGRSCLQAPRRLPLHFPIPGPSLKSGWVPVGSLGPEQVERAGSLGPPTSQNSPERKPLEARLGWGGGARSYSGVLWGTRRAGVWGAGLVSAGSAIQRGCSVVCLGLSAGARVFLQHRFFLGLSAGRTALPLTKLTQSRELLQRLGM